MELNGKSILVIIIDQTVIELNQIILYGGPTISLFN